MKDSCELCGLPLPQPPVRLGGDDARTFCCQGCAMVWQAASQAGVLDQVTTSPERRRRATVDVLTGRGETAYFDLEGMWCAGCAVSAERLLAHEPGVLSADVSFAAQRGRVQYDPRKTSAQSALARLAPLGYRPRLLADAAEIGRNRLIDTLLLRVVVAAILGMQVMVLYLLLGLYPLDGEGEYASRDVRYLQVVVLLLSTPVMLYSGKPFLTGAWRALKARTATMDTLVALGTF